MQREHEAIEPLRRAADLYVDLGRQSPNAPIFRVSAATALYYPSEAYLRTGDPERAEAAANEALELLREKEGHTIAADKRANLLGITYHIVGRIQLSGARFAAAQSSYESAIEHSQRAMELDPRLETAANVIRHMHGLGLTLFGLGENTKGISVFMEAIAEAEDLAREASLPEPRRLLADLYTILGSVLVDMRQSHQAKEYVQKACTVLSELKREYPKRMLFRTMHAYACLKGGRLGFVSPADTQWALEMASAAAEEYASLPPDAAAAPRRKRITHTH